MKVTVDFSIFTESEGSFGNVSGDLDVSVAPQVGDSISLLFSDAGASIDPSIGFSGILKVTERIITANQESKKISLALEDVVVKTRDDAKKLAQYLEDAFNLFAVDYSE